MAYIDNLPKKERKPPQLELYQAVGLALALIERAKGKPVAIWMLSGVPKATKLDSRSFKRYQVETPGCWIGTYDDEATEMDIERDLAEFYPAGGA